MKANREVAPGDGLRQLARMVIADDVSGDTLSQYLCFLIEDQLVELDANARVWPRTLTQTFCGLSAGDLAAMLVKRADDLDGDQ